MKLRKVLAVTLVAAMTMSMAACGGSNNTAGNRFKKTGHYTITVKDIIGNKRTVKFTIKK